MYNVGEIRRRTCLQAVTSRDREGPFSVDHKEMIRAAADPQQLSDLIMWLFRKFSVLYLWRPRPLIDKGVPHLAFEILFRVGYLTFVKFALGGKYPVFITFAE